MNTFKKTDNIIVLLFLVFSLIYGHLALKMPYFGRGIIGAAFFPKILAVIMLVLCIIFFAVSILIPQQEKPMKKEEVKKADFKDILGPALVIVLIAAYAFGLFKIGFKISTFLFFLLMLALYGERRWLHLIVLPLLTTAFFDIVFRVIFKLPLRELSIF